jgi:hypothetical protein
MLGIDHVKDAYRWTVKKVSDHPGVVILGSIGAVVGSPLGPIGMATLGGIGASIGNTLDQPKPGEPKPDDKP